VIEVTRQIVIVRPEIDDPPLPRAIKDETPGIRLVVQANVFGKGW
jgi:hypothetical protein